MNKTRKEREVYYIIPCLVAEAPRVLELVDNRYYWLLNLWTYIV